MFSIFTRCNTDIFFEYFDKVACRVKAQIRSHFINRIIRTGKDFAGQFLFFFVYIMGYCNTVIAFKAGSQIFS